MALHHPELYGLKPFEQVLSESLLANLINFGGVFSNVFWAGTGVSILDVLGLDGYLGVRKSLRKYGLIFASQLLDCHGVCFTWNIFYRWKRFDPRDPILTWFVSVTNFVKNSGLDINVTVMSYSAPTKFFHDVGFTSEHLLVFKSRSIEVYIDEFVKSLGSISVYGSTAAYFLRANASINVKFLAYCP
ncbi:hypothetical protein G9A89_007906 [Geosiphon pyriformis]|nr:hypothetical protein G9A89_007906 [Geosiphon pyriformis]